jgi:hypothetical protein
LVLEAAAEPLERFAGPSAGVGVAVHVGLDHLGDHLDLVQHGDWDDARSKAVGWDGESPILACFDRYMVKKAYPTIPLDTVREYVAGFRSVLGSASGFYGFYDTMRACVEEDWVPFRMQCGARAPDPWNPGVATEQLPAEAPRHRDVELELYVPMSTVFSRKDDDMQLSDRMKNAWGGEPTIEEVLRYVDLRAAEAAENSAANGVKLDALLGRPEGGDVDEAELARQLLAQGLKAETRKLSDEEIVILKKAVGDEIEHRERVRLNVDLDDAEARENGQ